MRDFFNVGGAVLAALLFAASQLGDLYAPQGAKFTQARLIGLTPSLTDYATALGDGTVLDAARARIDAARDGFLQGSPG